MHGPLNNRTYLAKKKMFFGLWGANFLVPKSSHQHEKQPVLGPVLLFFFNGLFKSISKSLKEENTEAATGGVL